ncbi:MAG: 50S ribosomal protein L22 [Dehalococcoidia bacterium]
MEVRAIAKNVSVSPKKLRRIVDTVRGKPVSEAMVILQFIPSPAAGEVAKVVKSAAANAENNFQMDPERLRIVRITADEGIKLRRYQPMARGRAGTVHKRHSHITVVVDQEEGDVGT